MKNLTSKKIGNKALAQMLYIIKAIKIEKILAHGRISIIYRSLMINYQNIILKNTHLTIKKTI